MTGEIVFDQATSADREARLLRSLRPRRLPAILGAVTALGVAAGVAVAVLGSVGLGVVLALMWLLMVPLVLNLRRALREHLGRDVFADESRVDRHVIDADGFGYVSGGSSMRLAWSAADRWREVEGAIVVRTRGVFGGLYVVWDVEALEAVGGLEAARALVRERLGRPRRLTPWWW